MVYHHKMSLYARIQQFPSNFFLCKIDINCAIFELTASFKIIVGLQVTENTEGIYKSSTDKAFTFLHCQPEFGHHCHWHYSSLRQQILANSIVLQRAAEQTHQLTHCHGNYWNSAPRK